MKRSSLIVVFILLALNFVTQAQPETVVQILSHDGLERTYRLFVPENADKLLIALHPEASNGYTMQLTTGFDEIAAEYSFAVVYPDSAGLYWDSARSINSIPPFEPEVDDTGFLATLADSISAEYGIDNVYLTGLGNGAEMAYLAACTSERYQGVAAIGALATSYQTGACTESSTALDTLVVWGTQDNYFTGITYDIALSSGTQTIFSTDETVDWWATHNTCDTENAENPFEYVRVFSCAEDTQTAFVEIENGTSMWYRTGDSKQLNQNGLDMTTLVAEFFSGSETWTESANITGTETSRSWITYIPDNYDPETTMPLVLLLHGRTASGANQAWSSDFNSIAQREGVIAVYPEGISLEWNYTRPELSQPDENLPDDEAFIAALLDDLALDFNIDTDRVYVTGLSNGGFMSQRLACTMQDRITAFASVAATGTFRLPELCANQGTMPALYIHGTADNIVPWDGMSSTDTEGNEFFVSAPMSRTIGFWADHNGCGSDLDIEDIPRTNDETQTRILNVTECPEDAPVIVYMVVNGGHTWHGVSGNSNFLGFSSQDFNSSEVIWEFFTRFTLN